MKKKSLATLAALTICISLTACGQGKGGLPASETVIDTDVSSTEADAATAAVEDDNASSDTEKIESESIDVAGENGEADTETDEGLADGTYEHHIGDCVFYTENDINQWIDNGVFDFYGMMDYFGFSARIMDEADCCVARTTSDDTYSGIRLSDDMDPFGYSTFIYSTRGGEWVTVIFSDYGEDYLRTKNDNMKVSREMCEMLLYFMEQYDRYGQDDPQPVLAMAEFSYNVLDYITVVTKGI